MEKTPNNQLELAVALLHRLTVALEKSSRHLSAIEEALLTIVDGNDKSLRMKDIERAKVYSTHLGKKLKGKKDGG